VRSAERARKQACRFGAEFFSRVRAFAENFADGKGIGFWPTARRLLARSAICATGVAYRRLGVPNEEKYFGAGLYYGAGTSEAHGEGPSSHRRGCGNSAGQAALNSRPRSRQHLIFGVVLDAIDRYFESVLFKVSPRRPFYMTR